jgi:hypothetical protein
MVIYNPVQKQSTRLLPRPYAGYCAYSINGVESSTFNGICGTPMPPPFDADFYTFTIEPANGGYNMLTVTKQ